jgi:hypothetical protein
MKKEIKVYLEPETIAKLKLKAEELGFTGRGAISHYIEKISLEPVVFLDSNVKSILEALRLKSA